MTRQNAIQTQQQAASASPLSRGGILQRKCESCGQHTIAGAECTDCGKKKIGLQRKLTIGASNDPLELEADRVADRVMAASANSVVSSAPPRIQRFTGQTAGQADMAAPASVDSVLSSPGSPLEPGLQQDMGQRFGQDFSRVRVHTGDEAARSAQDVNANAYTVGQDIVFGAGRFAPRTNAGRRLIAHELTHVVQQSGSDGVSCNEGLSLTSIQSTTNGQMIVARETNDDADAKVSLGPLDNPLVGAAVEELVGKKQWQVLREFLRGLSAGMQSMPPEQQQRINKKFEDFGVKNALKYVGGYGIGIFEGIGISIKGLVEAVITLVKLPYDIGQFLGEKVPELAARYGPRIAQFVTEGNGLTQRLNKIIDGFIKEPVKNIKQISSFLDMVGNLALVQVRALGRSAAGKILNLLEEEWFAYGRDIGKVVGQILFEVILAVASDAIGNIVKEAVTIAGRISARLVTGAVELIKSAGRFLGEAVEWLAQLGRKFAGEMGEMFEGLRTLLSKLKTLIAELGEEGALANTSGGRVPIPEVKPPVLESRMVKPPTRTAPATVSDLTPPKVHPSNVPKEVPSPSGMGGKETIEEFKSRGGEVKKIEPGKTPEKSPSEVVGVSEPKPPEGFEDLDVPIRTEKQAGVRVGEDHHVLTRYRKENKKMFEKIGFDVDDDFNLIKDFKEHGELRGWQKWDPEKKVYIPQQRGHHPEYNEWATEKVKSSIKGLRGEKRTAAFKSAVQEIASIVEKYPDILAYGPKIFERSNVLK